MTINVDSNTTVVFDLDDTLYKEIDYLKSAYIEIAKELNPQNWKYTYAHMFALYRAGNNVFNYLEENFRIDKKLLIETYRTHIPDIKLTQEITDLLDSIINCGAQVALITDGRSITQRNKIEALGLPKWVNTIIVSEELGSEKPAENNFKAVEKASKSTDFYYIADNMKKDFITPNTLGWGTVGLVDNGLNIHVYPDFYDKNQHLPAHFVLSLDEIEVSK